MEKFKGKYRIPPNRAQFWNYSLPADYFITICVANRECILGNIIDGEMILSEYGKIVKSEIEKLSEYHKRVILDEWIIMPNHIHFIISLGDYNFDNGISVVGDNVEKIHEFSLPSDGRNVEKIDEFSLPSDGRNVEKIDEFSLPSDGRNVENTHEFSLPSDGRNVEKTHEFSLPLEHYQKEYRKLRRRMLIPKILGKFKQQTSKQINLYRNTPGIRNWQSSYYDHIIRNYKSYLNIKNYIINNPQKWNDDRFYNKRNV